MCAFYTSKWRVYLDPNNLAGRADYSVGGSLGAGRRPGRAGQLAAEPVIDIMASIRSSLTRLAEDTHAAERANEATFARVLCIC